MNRLLLSALSLLLALSVLPATAADFQVVAGTPAEPGAYPWFATVQIDFRDGDGPVHWCGGSLVAPEWVLSAAHCYTSPQNGEPVYDVEDLSVIIDTVEWADPSQGQHIDVIEIVVYPTYQPAGELGDMVLFRLAEPADADPIRLAEPADVELENPPTVGRVVGFGDTGFGRDEPSPILLEADLPLVTDEECSEAGEGYIIPAIHVCAGGGSGDPDNPNPDSCQGDSGGPLFVPDEPVLLGVTSFGTDCGITDPGAYAQVSAFRAWIDGVLDGELGPGDPDPDPPGQMSDGAETVPLRIEGPDGDDPVGNAIAVSRVVFTEGADYAVLAASARFPDALGGSALAGHLGPLLYVDEQGQLPDEVLVELRRVLDPDGRVYLLGGEAVIPAAVESMLGEEGFDVDRLAGPGRQETAVEVAQAVSTIRNDGGPAPFDAVIVAFEGNWPDAVAVGQISSWFGIPVLLTPRDQLGVPAADYLRAAQPANVIVLGGDAVISPTVRQQIRDLTTQEALIELAGDTRITTSALMTQLARQEMHPVDVFDLGVVEPAVIVVANLRRDDAFAHLLAASPLLGAFAGVVAPLDGADTAVQQVVLDSICGLDARVLVMGSGGLVPDEAVDVVQLAAQGQGCTSSG